MVTIPSGDLLALPLVLHLHVGHTLLQGVSLHLQLVVEVHQLLLLPYQLLPALHQLVSEPLKLRFLTADLHTHTRENITYSLVTMHITTEMEKLAKWKNQSRICGKGVGNGLKY